MHPTLEGLDFDPDCDSVLCTLPSAVAVHLEGCTTCSPDERGWVLLCRAHLTIAARDRAAVCGGCGRRTLTVISWKELDTSD
jgi:hypothetical protein